MALRVPVLLASVVALVGTQACAAAGTSTQASRPAATAGSATATGPAATAAATGTGRVTRTAVSESGPAATRRHTTRRHTTRRPGARAPKPKIVWDPIPFGPVRKAQMVAYVRRHYGSFMKPTWRLTNPRVIVIHYTEAGYSSTFNTFANDVPDSELHELPATCAHFVIDTDGTIHQLVSLRTMCRHTVGLNWTAIGVEHVGYSDAQVLGDGRQLAASLTLVRWLRCRYGIAVGNVIGHNESLASPFHHEDVPSLRTQTHSDFGHADMQVYRSRLRRLGGC